MLGARRRAGGGQARPSRAPRYRDGAPGGAPPARGAAPLRPAPPPPGGRRRWGSAPRRTCGGIRGARAAASAGSAPAPSHAASCTRDSRSSSRRGWLERCAAWGAGKWAGAWASARGGAAGFGRGPRGDGRGGGAAAWPRGRAPPPAARRVQRRPRPGARAGPVRGGAARRALSWRAAALGAVERRASRARAAAAAPRRSRAPPTSRRLRAAAAASTSSCRGGGQASIPARGWPPAGREDARRAGSPALCAALRGARTGAASSPAGGLARCIHQARLGRGEGSGMSCLGCVGVLTVSKTQWRFRQTIGAAWGAGRGGLCRKAGRVLDAERPEVAGGKRGLSFCGAERRLRAAGAATAAAAELSAGAGAACPRALPARGRRRRPPRESTAASGRRWPPSPHRRPARPSSPPARACPGCPGLRGAGGRRPGAPRGASRGQGACARRPGRHPERQRQSVNAPGGCPAGHPASTPGARERTPRGCSRRRLWTGAGL
jgi:hypothetical protein